MNKLYVLQIGNHCMAVITAPDRSSAFRALISDEGDEPYLSHGKTEDDLVELVTGTETKVLHYVAN